MDKASRYKALVDNLYDGVYYVDRNRTITYWNAAAERITGFRAEEVLKQPCFANILEHIDDSGKHLCFDGCPLHQTLKDGKLRESDVYLRQKNGRRRPVTVRVSPVRDEEGSIVGAVEVFTDNSTKLAILDQLKEAKDSAFLDHLTGICNRRALDDYLADKFREFHQRGWAFGIGLIDVDHFKAVNDTHGHAVGDQALKMIAQTLATTCRSFDIVGRWGGEEFLVIYANIDAEHIRLAAERHRAIIENSFVETGSGRISVTVSIGITLAQAEDDPATLIARADRALYQSKLGGRNRVTCL